MSWSIQLVGDARGVGDRLRESFSKFIPNLKSPEAEIAESARCTLETSLINQTPGTIVSVKAYGSQSEITTSVREGVMETHVTNNIHISVETFHGFIPAPALQSLPPTDACNA